MRFTIVAILVFMALVASVQCQSRLLYQCRKLAGNECKQCCGRHGYDADASVSSVEKNLDGEDVTYCYCDDGLDD